MTLNGSLNVIYVVCCAVSFTGKKRDGGERYISWQIWGRFFNEDLIKGFVVKVTVVRC